MFLNPKSGKWSKLLMEKIIFHTRKHPYVCGLLKKYWHVESGSANKIEGLSTA